MADEVKTIRIVVDASRAVDGSAAATRAWDRMERSQAAATSSLERMEKALGGVGIWLKANLAMMAADLVARLVQMAKSAFDAASNLGELSEQLGITSQGLQALQLSAVQNNLKLEQLETGISKFSQKIGEAAGGSKQMIDALNEIGVKILDMQGNLRPTEDVLTDVAKAITSMDDPAKRAAAAVDFFGKAGTRMLPTLRDIAGGLELMEAKARAAGTMISDETSAKLDTLGDRAERVGLVLRRHLAEGLVWIVDFIDRNKNWLAPVIIPLEWLYNEGPAAFQRITVAMGDWLDSGRSALDDMVVAGGRFAAGFLEALRSIPEQLGKLFVDGMNAALEALENGLNRMTGALADSWLGQALGINGQSISLGRLSGGGASATDRNAGIKAAEDEAEKTLRERYTRDYAGERALQRAADAASAFYADEGVRSQNTTTGSRNPTASGSGGESPEEKYAKLMRQLQETAAAQDLMTEAARRGDTAFEAQKTHVDAVQKTMEIFGQRLDDNDPRLVKLEERLRAIAQGKIAEAFAVATTELERQNAVLEVEIELIGQLPEVRARELAIIKAKQEAEKAGAAITAEDIDRRIQAVEINERLKIQADEIRKAQELWTEPLKQALRDIQQVGADAFMQMLDSGKFSFEALGKTFSTIIKRMIAEFLALATIRPVMSVVVNAISPQIAQQMGMSAGGSSGGGIGSIGGGGLGGLFGDGGFFSQPIASLFPSSTPAGGFANVGDLIASGQTGASAQAAGIGGLGGISIGQGLGALGGIGMGAYQLLGGNGSTASTIGGIASMVGGAVSLIPGVGQIAGPIISILGSVLPSLFGESKPTITDQAYGQLAWGRNGYGTTGGAWGPNANASSLTGPLGQTGATMQAIYDALGGVQDPSRVYGIALESFSQQYGNGSSFANQTSYVVGPDGRKRQWGMGSNAGDVGMGTAAANAVINSIMEGAVGAISDNLRTAFQSLGQDVAPTLDTVAQLVAEVTAFDKAVAGFGKTISDATRATNDALDQIDNSFNELFNTAARYGLSPTPIEDERARQRVAYGTDFADSLTRGILGIQDPTAAALFDLDRAKQDALDTNAVLLTRVEGYQDQILRIEEYYGLQRAKVVEEAGKAATDAAVRSVESLQDIIKRLQYGDLSTASPELTLSGTGASYAAALAQARAGDATAAANLPGLVESYVAAGKDYYGSSGGFQAINQQIQRDIVGLIPQVASAGGGASNQQINVLMQGMAQMQQMFADSQRENAQLRQQVAELTAAIKRAA